MIRAGGRGSGARIRWIGACAAVVCAWCVLVAGAAAAAVPGGRAAAQGLNGNPYPTGALAQVASDAAGDVVAVWWRDRGDGTADVQSAWRPAGGAWEDPVTLSAPSAAVSIEPRVAINAAGDAVAVWDHYNGSGYVVQAASRPAGGGWQTPVDVSAPGHNATESRVAINAAGLAIVVWLDDDGSSLNHTVQAAVRPAGGTWQAPVGLSAPSLNADRPDVAVNKTGAAVAVWDTYAEQGGVESARVQAAARLAGGAWGAPVNLSAWMPGCCAFAKVALDQAGNAVSVWGIGSSGTQAAVRPAASGTWQAARRLSAPGAFAGEAPEVAFGPTGVATAVWTEANGANDVIRAADRPVGGSFGAPATVSAPGQNAIAPQLAIAGGVTIAVWERVNGGSSVSVQAAARPAATGVWQPPLDLTAPGQAVELPQVAVDSAGDAVAVWELTGQPKTDVQAASRPATSGVWLAPEDISLPKTVAVPDVLEFSKTFAAQDVTAAGLIPRFTGAVTASSSYVVSETPAPGTVVPRGTTVTMRLVAGPPPP